MNGFYSSLRTPDFLIIIGYMLVLVGISAYLMAVSSGVVEARMRHPVMPMLCLAGGAGIAANRTEGIANAHDLHV